MEGQTAEKENCKEDLVQNKDGKDDEKGEEEDPINTVS